MTESEYSHIHASRYHYWTWVIKFYITHPACLWRDLWWRWMPGEIVHFNSIREWDRDDFNRWCWDNVGFRYFSWDLKIDNWIKDECYDFVIKVRRGRAKQISHLALVAK